MDSSTKRLEDTRNKRLRLQNQISSLQAQLDGVPDVQVPEAPRSPKRAKRDATTLVPATPSPKKKRKLEHKTQHAPLKKPNFDIGRAEVSSRKARAKDATTPAPGPQQKPSASNVLDKLASFNSRPIDNAEVETITRTTSFTEKPTVSSNSRTEDRIVGQKRDDRLALVSELEPGPYEHKAPSDDPDFLRLEPHSGIRLTSRTISHEELSEHLRGRYYLSPSQLYASVHLLPDNQGYDVPVCADWITIAVVAERGPLKYSRAPVTVGLDDEWKTGGSSGKGKKDTPAKLHGKKYVNLKLIDFGVRSQSSSSATGGKAVIRGDAFLSLLLFESDDCEVLTTEAGQKKIYKGGSRGAFEALMKLKEGDVIALLNPRILKPFQRSADTPHPVNNILALTPESAESIAIIGRSRDLGMCDVTKKDGKACGSWCDKRVSDVCEYHVQAAVQRQRAGRAEFSIGTSGMGSSSAPKRKPEYDLTRQWGLKPADEPTPSGATYIVSGHIVSGAGVDTKSLYLSETIGREGQAKAQRKVSQKDRDQELQKLLERDKDGMSAVIKAREVGLAKKHVKGLEGDVSGEMAGSKKKKKSKKSQLVKGTLNGTTVEENYTLSISKSRPGKNIYSAKIMKDIGFDPTVKSGQTRQESSTMLKKLEALENVLAARKDIVLGPRPGPKVRSGVVAPRQQHRDTGAEQKLIDLDEF